VKTTLKKLAAGILGLAGLALISAGLLGHRSNLAEAGWTLLALLAFALLAKSYRQVVQLHLRLDALVTHTGKLATAAELASTSRSVVKHGAMLESILQSQLELDQHVQRLEDAERAASRQAADGQHFVLRSFRELAQRHEELRDQTKKILGEITRSGSETVQQTEALLQLNRLFDVRGITPSLGGWAMEPSSVLALLSEIIRTKPDLVVECGSGTSSIWIGYALAANGKGRLVSLDHESEYAEKTRLALAAHKLDHLVEVRVAPLVPQKIANETYGWYDPEQIAGLENIDILIVDGPPGATGPLARFPAVPTLVNALSDTALVVIDDANRKDEKKTMQRWLQEFDGFSSPRQLAARTSVMNFERRSSI
jgi:predicted O-methyltransferase YrrM